ncbi:MAG: hypothetical protein LBJ82_06715 [Deltaproteobacteria bacterium]|nr:hypothetical protein [Deltaproteobacteria bacterium]
MKRIVLLGDGIGLPRLLRHVPPGLAAAVVAAANRPQGHEALAALAAERNLPFLIQPRRNAPEYPAFIPALRDLRADFLLCDSYSMLLPEEAFGLFRRAVNLHGGKLPEYRGANVLQWAMINGEREAGLTLHDMTAEADAGPVIASMNVPILLRDDWLDLRDRLGRAAENLWTHILPELLAGRGAGRPQKGMPRVWPRRGPEDGHVDIVWPVMKIYNAIRALIPPLSGAFLEAPDGRRRIFERRLSLVETAALKADTYPFLYGGLRLEPHDPAGTSGAVPPESILENISDLALNIFDPAASAAMAHPPAGAELFFSPDGATLRAEFTCAAGAEERVRRCLANFCAAELGDPVLTLEQKTK